MTTQPVDPAEQAVVLPKIRRKVLGDQLEARLRALPGLPVVTVYRGEVASDPPVLVDANQVEDASGRVAPYVVLFDGTGPVDLERALQPGPEQLRWTPTLTVAAGFSTDCAHTVDRVFAWCHRWMPSLHNVNSGWLEPPPGFDPGLPRPDRNVTPIRFSLSLSWQVDLTA